MPTGPLTSSATYLDSNCQRTIGEEDAVLIEKGQGQHLGIQSYQSELGELAEQETEKRGPVPVGYRGDGQEQEYGGYRFHWDINQWRYESATMVLLASPQTDSKDLERLLEVIRSADQRILKRGLSGAKKIEIGKAQYTREGKTVAAAVADERLIWFPVTKNGKNLMAVATADGSRQTDKPVSTEGILLHEISHILAKELRPEIGRIAWTFAQEWHRSKEAFGEVSPHYLATQYDEIQNVLENLKVPRTGDEEEGKRRAKLQRLSEEAAQEIAAEWIQYCYLESVLVGGKSEPKKTGWRELDGLTEVLERETRFCLRRTHGENPVFSPKRRQRLKITSPD